MTTMSPDDGTVGPSSAVNGFAQSSGTAGTSRCSASRVSRVSVDDPEEAAARLRVRAEHGGVAGDPQTHDSELFGLGKRRRYRQRSVSVLPRWTAVRVDLDEEPGGSSSGSRHRVPGSHLRCSSSGEAHPQSSAKPTSTSKPRIGHPFRPSPVSPYCMAYQQQRPRSTRARVGTYPRRPSRDRGAGPTVWGSGWRCAGGSWRPTAAASGSRRPRAAAATSASPSRADRARRSPPRLPGRGGGAPGHRAGSPGRPFSRGLGRAPCLRDHRLHGLECESRIHARHSCRTWSAGPMGNTRQRGYGYPYPVASALAAGRSVTVTR